MKQKKHLLLLGLAIILLLALGCGEEAPTSFDEPLEGAEQFSPNNTPRSYANSAPTMTLLKSSGTDTLRILIYGPSLSTVTPNEQTLAEAAGFDVTVMDAVEWANLGTVDFPEFDAIVFGDPNCLVGTTTLSAANANKTVWSPAITGAIYLHGLDPVFHRFTGDAQQMITSGIQFAASGQGTGLYVSLSCYYFNVIQPTAVDFLSEIGSFIVEGQNGCANTLNILDPGHPAMSGVTNAGLSNWSCSMHQWFSSFPASFAVIAEETSGSPASRAAIIAASPPGDRTLFGTDASGGNLLDIDQFNGIGTVVGSMGAGVVPALAVDPTTLVIYAGQGGGAPNLYTVNRFNGAATFVGDTGLGFAAIGGMDFREDGTLYAAVNLAGDGGTGSDHLAVIDKTTGAATVIGPFADCVGVTIPSNAGGSCGIEGIEGIAFAPDGTLWGSHSARGSAGHPGLYTIDAATGAATFVAPIQDEFGTPPSGGVVSLQFIGSKLFGGTARAMSPATDGGRLIVINPVTGRFTFVGPVSATGGSSLGGLAH